VEKHVFMRACREGGDSIEAALRALDRGFFAPLYREAQRAVRDPETARDLVQETFIKVWRRCATFKGDSDLLPWIRSILRREILDRFRASNREVPIEIDGRMTAEVGRHITALSGEKVAMPEDDLRRKQLAECFERCWVGFEEAAPAHAAVMSWIVVDGLSNDEISELLGRTPGATREFVSQCRKRARVHLAEWYELAFGGR
jgi:RNA polymerase sigma factor (sigma-70 family)